MLGILLQSRPRKQARNALHALPLRPPVGFGGTPHERRVAAISLKLFDLLQRQHGLGIKYRNLLHLAGLVHDAGKIHGAKGHDIRGAQMVMEDRRMPLSPKKRRALSYLVRFHRGAVPVALKDQNILEPGDKHGKLRILLGILRAADALDSRQLVPRAIIMKRTSRKLRITCLIEQSLQEAQRRMGGRRKFELLEDEVGLTLKLQFKVVMPDA